MRVERAIYLLSVMRHGSFRRAAADLNISQPTLSTQITALEEELDTVLLVRGRHGATPTPAAISLAPKLMAMVQAENDVRSFAMDLRDNFEGRVRIGATPLAAQLLVAPAVSHVSARYPALRFTVVEGAGTKIERAVRDGRLDFWGGGCR